MQETWVLSQVLEDPLEEEMATHSSILAWKIPQIEEPGGLQFMRVQRVGHSFETEHTHTHTHTHCFFLKHNATAHLTLKYYVNIFYMHWETKKKSDDLLYCNIHFLCNGLEGKLQSLCMRYASAFPSLCWNSLTSFLCSNTKHKTALTLLFEGVNLLSLKLFYNCNNQRIASLLDLGPEKI